METQSHFVCDLGATDFSFSLCQGSRLSWGMKALTMTPAKTSGVTYVSLKCTLSAGVLQAANPSYLQKVSPAESQCCVREPAFWRWLSLCSLLAGIQHKYSNWKAFLVKRLTGAKTLPPDFSTKVGLEDKLCLKFMRRFPDHVSQNTGHFSYQQFKLLASTKINIALGLIVFTAGL